MELEGYLKLTEEEQNLQTKFFQAKEDVNIWKYFQHHDITNMVQHSS